MIKRTKKIVYLTHYLLIPIGRFFLKIRFTILGVTFVKVLFVKGKYFIRFIFFQRNIKLLQDLKIN